MHEEDRIPPELDPAYADFDDDGPSRTLANRFRPIIWVVALLALVGVAMWAIG